MRALLSILFYLFIILTARTQNQYKQENEIIFSGFKEYGYTLYISIEDSTYTKTVMSGKCKIINNTNYIINRHVVSSTTIIGMDKLDKLLPGDTAMLSFSIAYPFARSMPRDEPIITQSWETTSYDGWDKDSLFNYLKNSNRYYQVNLTFSSSNGDNFSVVFKIPVNSIKEIIWTDKSITTEFSQIQQMLRDNNSTLGYFDYFSPKEKNNDGSWLALITNPHANILYLNYYLDKLLK